MVVVVPGGFGRLSGSKELHIHARGREDEKRGERGLERLAASKERLAASLDGIVHVCM